MKKKSVLSKIVPGAAALLVAFSLAFAPTFAFATDPATPPAGGGTGGTDECPGADAGKDDFTLTAGSKCAKGTGTPTNLFGGGGIFNTIVNVLLFIVGMLSVVMLIYGGIKYSTSSGDQTKVTSAKNTIMYAIVGLIVSILAFAIVNFITGSIAKDEEARLNNTQIIS